MASAMPATTSAGSPCPCGTGRSYRDCCRQLHEGQPAPTPETLMRSRYSAFVLRNSDYLLHTWHPTTRPETLDLDGSPDWARLQVISATGTVPEDRHGQVHFRAVYRATGGWGYLEEQSDFAMEQGRWFYLTGEPREGVLRPGRNELCPCGSGRKYKACCL